MRALTLPIMLSVGLASAAGAASSKPPVVIELFTSQGCSACLPADSLFGELAEREDVIALGLHVDYWDYMGWKDVFSQRAYSERQRRYSTSLNQRYIYTPQVIVNGVYQDVGSHPRAIQRLIEKAHNAAGDGPALAVAGDGARRTLRISEDKTDRTATVWLVGFDRKHETSVTAGENSGRHLINYNVVRAMVPIGTWTGNSLELALDLTSIPRSCDGAAVIVQLHGTGPIIAAVPLHLAQH